MASAVPEEVGRRRARRRRLRQGVDEVDPSAASPGPLSIVRQAFGLLVYVLFYVFLLVAPLPMGANRDWAWAPMVVLVGLFGLVCALGLAGREALSVSNEERTPLLFLVACFLLFVAVALLQMSRFAPPAASAWYYERAAELLHQPTAAVPSLAADVSRDAILRCLGCATIFLVARMLFRDPQWARLLLLVVALSAALVVGYAFYAEATTKSCYVGSFLKKQGMYIAATDHCVMSGTFVGSNNFGCFVGMGLVATLALFFGRGREEGRRARQRDDDFYDEPDGLAEWLSGANMALLALVLFLLGGALYSVSRAGVMATLAGAAMLGFLMARGRSRLRARRTAAIGVVIGLVIFGIAGGAFLSKLERLSDLNNLNRIVFWRQSLHMIAESPWLGWGLGTYPDVYAIHQPISIPQPNDKAHSTPLEFVVELGIPGAVPALAAGFLPWGACLLGVFRRRRRRYLPAAAFAVSGVAMLHSAIDFSLQMPAIAFFVSALLGMGWAQAFARSEAAISQRSFASSA